MSMAAGKPWHLSVLGHFGMAGSPIDGQIMRTRVVLDEFRKRLHPASVARVDTGQLKRSPVATLWKLRGACKGSRHVVIMPAERGLRYLVPQYLRWQRRFGARFHFFVVGGWLPDFLAARPQLAGQVRALGPLYVQTSGMQEQLRSMGFDQLVPLPNFRDYPVVAPCRGRAAAEALKLVFYSRITPVKGVELAIESVRQLSAPVTLDIWGPIADDYRERFSTLLAQAGERIRYRGVLDGVSIHTTLPQYDALVFPTTYAGEGFPGAILDAFSCGLPVIASNWRYNGEFVHEGVNGALVAPGDQMALDTCLAGFAANPERLRAMAPAALASAQPYHVDRVFPELMRTMGLDG